MSISDHKHMPELARRIEVFTGAGRRRNWSPEDKAAIIAESYVAGETVCAVARRHGLTPQQLFTWRRLAGGTRTAEAPAFVPAVAEMPAPTAAKRSRPRRSSASSIELEIDGALTEGCGFSNGAYRFLSAPSFDAAAMRIDPAETRITAAITLSYPKTMSSDEGQDYRDFPGSSQPPSGRQS